MSEDWMSDCGELRPMHDADVTYIMGYVHIIRLAMQSHGMKQFFKRCMCLYV